jgi:hypothetical protein
VTVVATFSSRTTLHVSSDLLHFDVVSADAPATRPLTSLPPRGRMPAALSSSRSSRFLKQMRQL